MVNPIINGTVLVIFGLTIGAVLQLSMLLSPGYLGDLGEFGRQLKEKRKKLGFIRFFKESQERAELTRNAVRTMPRSSKMAMAAFYGLIAVLILFVMYGPIEMRWLTFIGSVLAGFFTMGLIYSRARMGKIRIEGRSFFDVLPSKKIDK